MTYTDCAVAAVRSNLRLLTSAQGLLSEDTYRRPYRALNLLDDPMSNFGTSAVPNQTSTFQFLMHNQTSREQLFLAQRDAAIAQCKIYEIKVQNLQQLLQGTGPVQEASRNFQGDDGFPQSAITTQSPILEPTSAVHAYPNVRMVLHDDEGMAVATSLPARRLDSGAGQQVDGHSVDTLTPQFEWSLSNARDTPSMDQESSTKVFLQIVKQYQETLKEKESKLELMTAQQHYLLSEYQAAVTVRNSKITSQEAALRDVKKTHEKEKESLLAELTRKDNVISELRQQLQQQTPQSPQTPQTFQLRAGVKRGRFYMSRSARMECTNCGQIFKSEQDALENPACSHHAKAPCELTEKRMMEMFPDMLARMNPEDKGKLHYWPCCKQVGNPPPCRHTRHELRQG